MKKNRNIRKKIRINKTIFMIFLSAIFLFNTGICKSNLSYYLKSESCNTNKYIYYTVKPNDNLWNISNK